MVAVSVRYRPCRNAYFARCDAGHLAQEFHKSVALRSVKLLLTAAVHDINRIVRELDDIHHSAVYPYRAVGIGRIASRGFAVHGNAVLEKRGRIAGLLGVGVAEFRGGHLAAFVKYNAHLGDRCGIIGINRLTVFGVLCVYVAVAGIAVCFGVAVSGELCTVCVKACGVRAGNYHHERFTAARQRSVCYALSAAIEL